MTRGEKKMKQTENNNVFFEEATIFNNVKTKKSIYDFNCDYTTLKFNASKRCKEVLSMIYECCTIKRTIQVGTTTKLTALASMLEYAIEHNDNKLKCDIEEQFAIYSAKNMVVQSMHNNIIKRYYKPLIEQTYKAYQLSFNDNASFKKALKEWALKEFAQELDDSVLLWLTKLVGVKANNVSRYNKSLLKFLNENEYAKIIIYALTELALNKKQLSIKRMKEDVMDLNVMYNTFLTDIHIINEPRNITKKWLLYAIQCYALSEKTQTELKALEKEELYKLYKKELAKRKNLRSIHIQ